MNLLWVACGAANLPWTTIDALHRMILDDILQDFSIPELSEDERSHFNRVWHRLDPWPDVVGGMLRLKSKYIVAALSNGNMSLLTNMAKHAGIPWDCILSAEPCATLQAGPGSVRDRGASARFGAAFPS